MLIYLLKASLIWLLMLALYELLYARSRHYFANRAYLLATLFIGALLPLLPLHIWNVDYLQPVALQPANTAIPSAAATIPEGTAAAPVAFNWHYLLWWMYAAGIVVVLALIIREVIIIMRYAIYGHQKRVGAYKVFETGKQHPPFSFMGWIFIGGKENYTDEQLDYIIRHEAAHNSRKHWLDILIMQIALAVFWFHPLIWRLRYQLKMQHEYEADRIASGDNAYGYGHFLLQAAVYQSAPLIAHSFFYSPIKNRITMLTKKQKTNKIWYALCIPLVMSLTMAVSNRSKEPNHNLDIRSGLMKLNGYNILWKRVVNTDTLSMLNPITNKWEYQYEKSFQDPIALELNNEMVATIHFRNFIYSKNVPNKSTNPEVYPGFKMFNKYMSDNFLKKFPERVDYASNIAIINTLLDKKGKIVYYEISVGFDASQTTYTNKSLPRYSEMEQEIVKLIDDYGKISLNKEYAGKPVYVDEIARINFNH